MNAQRLRPLGTGDIFDEGFDLYKRNFVFLLLATAAAVVPLDIGLAFLTPRLLPALFDWFGLTSSRSDAFGIWIVTNLVWLIAFLPLYFAVTAPVAAAASARYLDQNATTGTVFRLCLRRTPALLLAALFSGLALALGAAFCGVLWLAAATRLLFTSQALLVEGLGPAAAMRRSGKLVGGYGSRVFGCLLLLGGVLFVVSLGLRLPLSYVVDSLLSITPGASSLGGGAAGGAAQPQIVSLISRGLAHLLLIPFVVCVITVLYYDLRIRKEGADIEFMAQDLNYPPLSALGPYLPPVPTFIPAAFGRPPVGRPPVAGGELPKGELPK